MAEETHAPAADGSTVTKVTDEELDAAAEVMLASEKKEETKAEEKSEEEVKEKTPEEIAEEERKADHSEKSALGRKVAKMERNLFNSLQKIEEQYANTYQTILERLEKISTKSTTEEDPDAETLVSKKEVKRIAEEIAEGVITKKQEQQTKAEKAYSDAYVKTLIAIEGSEEDTDLFNSVVEELDANKSLYLRETGNPVTDAKYNYQKALVNILKKDKTVANPLKGEKSKLATGVSGTTKIKEAPIKMPKLEGIAAEFAASLGKDENWVKEALK